ncbi:phage tail tube protein [Acutalibacter caecimuris]|uniref:phage tail tube protein n=1 Tax=Acutalibacter caecimuris TaxID=3093657 RepID=UPI002AC9103A|nr:phage tail tube protein [Acutalibacter sp. M00118]
MNGNGTPIMHARDAISASLAECFVTIEGNRYNFMQMINLEANFEKTKSEVPILGKPGKGNKSTGWKGTGSATMHYNSSIMRELFVRYKETGQDIYFDIQVTNEDPTSTVGRQTVILVDCNLDGGTLAHFDADAEYLDEDMDFTFEDFQMPEKFTMLEGMM